MPELTQQQQQKVDRAGALAREFEQKYGSCPQCILSAIREVFGGVEENLFRAGFAFGGGGASTTEGTCGALCGALLVVASSLGRPTTALGQPLDTRCIEINRALIGRFRHKYQGVRCKDVQTCIMGRAFYLADPEEKQLFLAAGGHDDKCPSVTEFAARDVATLIVTGELPWPPERESSF